MLKIADCIGAGAFGIVFRATETSSGRTFAVKIVSNTPCWRQEAIIHYSLPVHPNVITLYTIAEFKDYACIVLDYCDGPDLYHLVRSSDMFAGDTDAIKRVFLQIIDAVKHCHDHFVYHRDLKLENVLYDSHTGQVFLTDFGVSTDQCLSTEYRVGTVKNMSPGKFQIDPLLLSR